LRSSNPAGDETKPLDLTDDERAALIALSKRTLDYARYPYSPRLDPLKAILAKLEPGPLPHAPKAPAAPYQPPPPLPRGAAPSVGRGRRRR